MVDPPRHGKARPALAAGSLALLLLLAGCGGTTTTVAPSLAASCSASPSSGVAPLAVQFGLNVAGAQGAFSVKVSYGDGASGTDAGVGHTYASAGAYTASFTVATASQSALCTANIKVDTPPPPTTTAPAPNLPPTAEFRTTPELKPGTVFTGPAPMTVQFNMCQTADPEGDPLNFKIDFEGDGKFEVDGPTGSDCRRGFTYPAGVYSPNICVTDLNANRAPAHPYQCRTYSLKLLP